MRFASYRLIFRSDRLIIRRSPCCRGGRCHWCCPRPTPSHSVGVCLKLRSSTSARRSGLRTTRNRRRKKPGRSRCGRRRLGQAHFFRARRSTDVQSCRRRARSLGHGRPLGGMLLFAKAPRGHVGYLETSMHVGGCQYRVCVHLLPKKKEENQDGKHVFLDKL